MRPIILKGHQRPITTLRFNREGDLLFSAARDFEPCLWFSQTGERIGTYQGHTGAVYDLDITWDSSTLVTASADQTVMFWDVMSGKSLCTLDHGAPVRCSQFSLGEKLLLTAAGNPSKPSTMYIYNVSKEDDFKAQESKPIMEIVGGHEKCINRVVWTNLNKHVISVSDDGTIRKFDTEKGKELQCTVASKTKKAITSAQVSHDGTMIICGCKDNSAKLIDTKSLEIIKEYKSTRPINDACMSPVHPTVLIGGGQDERTVTVTAASQGRFEVEFFHAIFEDFVGDVKGHFGPVQALCMASSGKTYASGSEDGYVRLHHLDPSFLDLCSKLPGKECWK